MKNVPSDYLDPLRLDVPSLRASIFTKALVALVGKERRRPRGTI